ncbi:hypothetical protein [Capnocytophaga catalasegens]|uniref:Membrane-binding protein n=1 Tax=Capnocytophaga catalasegens TaxID=1004260 RepID=A0AAV5AU81_9FLAO|nr:hypothetical protein [Capnocytophaga catalasegens]GIZ14060.1 hypothetical protein RCZ03_00610 [Capnocytophaga catalasegens]GJM49058.1 hypothetical protein RCZ15_00340 [Capnocytophaga catalasegens]GJM52319.1 hypothetical protein RCZ16_06370 [Capnocytophaga catalasegens]
MAKVRKSFAELVSQGNLMNSGLKNNLKEVSKRGLESDFIEELEKLLVEAIEENNQQEKLKAELKNKTKSFNEIVEKIQSKMSEAKKVVKLSIDQSLWKEFGINDKR